MLAASRFDASAEDAEEFGEPGIEGGPSRASDEVAVDEGVGHGEIDVGAAGDGDIRAGGRIGAALLSFEDASCSQNLRGVTNGSEWFVGLREMMDDFDDSRVEAQVFRLLNPRVIEIVHHFSKANKPLAAICHAPQILDDFDD